MVRISFVYSDGRVSFVETLPFYKAHVHYPIAYYGRYFSSGKTFRHGDYLYEGM